MGVPGTASAIVLVWLLMPASAGAACSVEWSVREQRYETRCDDGTLVIDRYNEQSQRWEPVPLPTGPTPAEAPTPRSCTTRWSDALRRWEILC